MTIEAKPRVYGVTYPSLKDRVVLVTGTEVPVNDAAHDQRVKVEDVMSEYWDDRIAVNLKHPLAGETLAVRAQPSPALATALNFFG